MVELLRPYLAKLLIALAVLAALLAGVWGFNKWVASVEQRGWDRREAQVQKDADAAKIAAGRKLQENVKDSGQRNFIAEAQVDRIDKNAVKAQATLTTHFATLKERHDPAVQVQPSCNLADSRLDRLTLRVLNDARAEVAAGDDVPRGSAARTDEDSGAAADADLTDITGAAFALNDREVVRLYSRLAVRHNGLVAWVRAQCAMTDFSTDSGNTAQTTNGQPAPTN